MALTDAVVEWQTSEIIRCLFEDEHGVECRAADDLETDGPTGGGSGKFRRCGGEPAAPTFGFSFPKKRKRSLDKKIYNSFSLNCVFGVQVGDFAGRLVFHGFEAEDERSDRRIRVTVSS